MNKIAQKTSDGTVFDSLKVGGWEGVGHSCPQKVVGVVSNYIFRNLMKIIDYSIHSLHIRVPTRLF